MESSNSFRNQENRGRSADRKEGSEGGTHRDVARKAVASEAAVKTNMGPSVSMTVVGETVTFTQNFNF